MEIQGNLTIDDTLQVVNDVNSNLCGSICGLQTGVTSLQKITTNGTFCPQITCDTQQLTINALINPVLLQVTGVNMLQTTSSFLVKWTTIYLDPYSTYNPSTGLFGCPIGHGGFYTISYSVIISNIRITNATSDLVTDTISASCQLYVGGIAAGYLSWFDIYTSTGTLTLTQTGLYGFGDLQTAGIQCVVSANTVGNTFANATVSGNFNLFRISNT